MRFKHELGESSGQQTWEALALLVALRAWKEHWFDKCFCLTTKSDSVSALTLLAKLKASGSGPNLVARELALDLGDSAFKPSHFIHTPGVANVLSDRLSRIFQPDSKHSVPETLLDVPRTSVPTRISSYYRTTAKQ